MKHFHETQIFPWNTNIFMKHFHETQIFPWNTNISMKHFHETQIFPWNTNIFMKHFHETQIFPWNTNISMKHFHETKNLSVKYNIRCFEAKIIFLFCKAFLAEHKSSYTQPRESKVVLHCVTTEKILISHHCEEGIWSTALSTFICQPLQPRFQCFPGWLFM